MFWNFLALFHLDVNITNMIKANLPKVLGKSDSRGILTRSETNVPTTICKGKDSKKEIHKNINFGYKGYNTKEEREHFMRISPLDISFVREILPFISFVCNETDGPFSALPTFTYFRPLRNYTFKTHYFASHLKLSFCIFTQFFRHLI